MTAKPKRIPTQRSQDRAHKRKPCIDCTAEGITTKRKAPHPGPRCVTHHRAIRSQRKSRTQEQRWMDVYGITAEQYWAIYEAQGGYCYICRRANGKRKRLSVDHCHATGVVRGLLCTACNRNVLGHLRDDPEAFERALDYLDRPPAVRAIGVVVVPDHVSET
ncbi:endonuclease VII [Mycobacterium phage Severus]|uniref:endonuclease VII n=1 Tax=Mycobacterium phage Severus TaxID=1327776 RepID=UPI00032B37BD|nr:endonuclease VII [Mycobacterium phage Severus]YP_009124975.1 endonuclease VII [Mycobacterium phage Trike]AVO22456.1 endonuclease VII [Mycobacterium phage KittenMittens]QWS69341.1 endonuclease VII [Mycobacterium Phage PeaceMeal1]QZD97041.1 endonuclease VII [Mycobacterium phage Drake94]USL89188.1 endonuclease VII [Mycobacterium phage Poompha]AGK87989.1 EndoVII protein [Mycobacterium phage Severus]